MTTYLALSPVTAAVYTALNVAALTALAPGGVYDALPQAPTYPCVLIEASERNVGGFGPGSLPEVTLRVHVFSAYKGFKEAQAAMNKVIQLLRDQSLAISGYAQCGLVFYDRTLNVGDVEVNGVLVHELVGDFRIYAESL